MIYLDNAATTFPKPPGTLEAMVRTYRGVGVTPGRGSYDLAVQAGDLVDQVRRQVARLFGAPDPDRVVFAGNATDALNLALHGLLRPGDHVVATELEHNSVLRPLHHLREQGADHASTWRPATARAGWTRKPWPGPSARTPGPWC